MIKDENYYVIHGWMRNRLGLNGNKLIVYAILYGFSQDGESEFRGSVDYITEFTGAGEKTIRNTLNALVGAGLVKKVDRNKEKGETNGYVCIPLDEVLGVGKNYHPPWQKLPTGVVKTTTGGRQNLPPIINLNKESNKELNIEVSKKESKNLNINKNLQSYDEIFEDFCVKPFVKEAYFKFIAHLKLNHGVTMLNDRLQTLIVRMDLSYREDGDKVRALNEAVAHNYKFLECEIA